MATEGGNTPSILCLKSDKKCPKSVTFLKSNLSHCDTFLSQKWARDIIFQKV